MSTTVSVGAAAGSGGLPDWARALTDSFDVEGTTSLVMTADVAAAWPQRSEDAEFRALLRASVTENIQILLDLIAGRVEIAEVALCHPAEFGRAQAELRIPQTALQHSYRVGFLTIWERWTAHLTAGGRDAEIQPEDVLIAVQNSTRLIFDYQDYALRTVAAEYSRVDEALRISREHMRRDLIRQLVIDRSRDRPATRDVQLMLGYDTTVSHVAILVTECSDTDIDRIATCIRRTYSAQSMQYQVDESHTVAWFGRHATWRDEILSEVKQILAEAGLTASLSSAASGISGLRSTYAEVMQIEHVRGLLGPSHVPAILFLADVRLEALLASDLDRAHKFAVDELRDLAEDRAEAAKLRDTLQVWFCTGSHVATAETLQVHEHTIRNRLRRAEECLGHPLSQRRTEIQVALRLLRLDGPKP